MWKLVEECLPDRIDSENGNNIISELLAGGRVDYLEQSAGCTEALGKIAQALEVGRHRNKSGVLGPGFALSFIQKEKEQLLLVPLDQFGDVHRPAESGAGSDESIRGLLSL